jgi:amino acid transporter
MRTIVCLITAVSVLAGVTAAASAGGSGSSCQANRTFAQASRNGSLPAVYASLHGGAAPKVSFLNCLPKR